MRPTTAALVLPAMFLSGCISYSSHSSHPPPPPVVSEPPTSVVCLYGGQPYSPGATVYPPNSGALQCRGDGSWYPI